MRRRRRNSARRLGLPALTDLRLLTAQPAEVVELGPSYVAAGHDLDAVDDRSVHGERPLHTDAKADLANGERLAHTAILAADDHTLEVLHAGPVALHHSYADVERVARSEGRDVVAQGGSVDAVERVHGEAPGRETPCGCAVVMLGLALYCAISSWPTSSSTARSRSSSVAGSSLASRSGRRRAVLRSASSRCQRATALWSPESKTGGTSRSRHCAGRVYAGPSSRPAACESSTTDSGLPTTPGSSRVVASTMVSAATSPPAST